MFRSPPWKRTRTSDRCTGRKSRRAVTTTLATMDQNTFFHLDGGQLRAATHREISSRIGTAPVSVVYVGLTDDGSSAPPPVTERLRPSRSGEGTSFRFVIQTPPIHRPRNETSHQPAGTWPF